MNIQSIYNSNYLTKHFTQITQKNTLSKSNQNVQFKGALSKTMTVAGSLAGFGVATTTLNVMPINAIMAVAGVLTIIGGSIMGHNWGITIEDKIRKKLANMPVA